MASAIVYHVACGHELVGMLLVTFAHVSVIKRLIFVINSMFCQGRLACGLWCLVSQSQRQLRTRRLAGVSNKDNDEIKDLMRATHRRRQ